MPRIQTKTVEKKWGQEIWVDNNHLYCGKLLVLEPGFQSSSHYHVIKTESWYVLSGQVKLELWDLGNDHGLPHTEILNPGDAWRLNPGEIHRFSAVGSEGAIIVEVSSQHFDEDSYRFEESRKV